MFFFGNLATGHLLGIFRSLDVPFAYHFAFTPVRTGVYNHKSMAENQWDLKIGDKLHEKIRYDHCSERFD
jgi:hypothetical protein